MAAHDIVMGAAGASGPATYIEDVFSSYLYTGNGAAQTITSGIDLSTYGGLVWEKDRNNANGHHLWDTARGAYMLKSHTTDAQTATSGFTFNTNGFTIPLPYANVDTHVAWTFRKQPKFFDVVTYTGTGVARTIAHNLGSAPGCIIIKRTDVAGYDWAVYHRSLTTPSTYKLALDTTAAQAGPNSIYWNSTDPTSSVFSLGTWGDVNANGGSYVAYLFAHNAGGFGLTGADNVISCGTYTGTGAAGNAITLGYEPQWILAKCTSLAGGGWFMLDTMRGMTSYVGSTTGPRLLADQSVAEADSTSFSPSATGFTVNTTGASLNGSGATYIYIAIRRGPMKVPTDATKVFAPVIANPSGATDITTNFPVDFLIDKARAGSAEFVFDRLRGSSQTAGGLYIKTNVTDAEANTTGFASPSGVGFDYNTKVVDNFINTGLGVTTSTIYYNLRRAPSFFDEVCWTGSSARPSRNHNLGVKPELYIEKSRGSVQNWTVAVNNLELALNSTAAGSASTYFPDNATATTFKAINDDNGIAYVTYFFATCPGVSKVGNYTGNGSSQTINCGFSAGARFVLIKRTDSTGDWYVWDTARGIVSGNDPYLLLNGSAAEVTTNDTIDPDSTGFIVNQLAATNVNVNAATYIFLAIA